MKSRALVISMLEDDRLYYAASIAAIHFDPVLDADSYYNMKNGLYNWASKKNIAKTPDNIDPDTGRKVNKQPAMWYGKTWKGYLSDIQWNHLCSIFEDLSTMHQRDKESGIDVEYWWNEETETLERQLKVPEPLPDLPDREQSSHALPSVSEKRIKQVKIWSLIAAVCMIGFGVWFFSIDRDHPVEMAGEPTFTPLYDDVSFQEALKLTKRNTISHHQRGLNGWSSYLSSWASRVFRPTGTFVTKPTLPLNSPPIVSSLP